MIESNLASLLKNTSHITTDSRQVTAGGAFVLLPKQKQHQAYVQDACARGASLIIVDETEHSKVGEQTLGNAKLYQLANLSQQLASLYAQVYDVAIDALQLYGITGTNGKTTIAHMLSQVLNSGYIGTLGLGALASMTETLNTTPNLDVLMPLFRNGQSKGLNQWAIEVSSHALTQQRLSGLPFKTAVFTNLSHDHLDYHKTMAAYAKAKYQLFLDYSLANAVICIDQDWGASLLQQLPKTVNHLSYALTAPADIYPINAEFSMQGMKLKLHTPIGELTAQPKLLGEFNLSNLMALIGILIYEDWPLGQIELALNQLQGIPGRMEIVSEQPAMVVDYAHTPDALVKSLATLKPLTKGKLWCIFGCGGDRDPLKRPVMAKAASQYANNIIITNDNPRTESPQAIIEQIQSGLTSQDNVLVILDRAQAISHAFKHAKANDAVLIAGKGHEDYQIIGNQKHYFSDQAVIRTLIANALF